MHIYIRCSKFYLGDLKYHEYVYDDVIGWGYNDVCLIQLFKFKNKVNKVAVTVRLINIYSKTDLSQNVVVTL